MRLALAIVITSSAFSTAADLQTHSRLDSQRQDQLAAMVSKSRRGNKPNAMQGGHQIIPKSVQLHTSIRMRRYRG